MNKEENMLQAIPALLDNYIWAWQLADLSWVVVDPGESKPVLSKCDHISYILLTHHHLDHTGGVSALKRAHPEAILVGPENSHSELDQVVTEGDRVLGMQVIATPGHTLDHVIYVDQQKALVGDHIFRFGCGRIFESDLATMYNSLAKVKSLDPNIMCYPAHEYTLSNLYFAEQYWPFAGLSTIMAQVKQQSITVPMLLSEQLASNPFLACKDFHEFCKLRLAKDVF